MSLRLFDQNSYVKRVVREERVLNAFALGDGLPKASISVVQVKVDLFRLFTRRFFGGHPSRIVCAPRDIGCLCARRGLGG